MKSTADLVRALSMCVMMLGLIAHPVPPCKDEKKVASLAGLVQKKMHETLTLYHKENRVAVWKNGFPELQVPSDALPVDQVCVRVKRGLLFMQTNLKIVREQQEELNPMATELDFGLGNVTESVRSHLLPLILAKVCTEATAQTTPATPPAPTTPTIWHTDKKKRWGQTVLKLSDTFLAWLAEWLNQCPLKNHQ